MSIALINHGNEIQVVTPTVNNNLIDHLPAKVYTIKIDPMTGALSLVIDRDKFELPKKFYGTLEYNRDIIWKTYKESKSSTGALLFGSRGMGKTILAETLCNKAIAMDIPVIFVRSNIHADILYFLSKNLSPIVFLFDEFEKLYHEDEDQTRLLTLFSDVDNNKNLFLVVGNDKDVINPNYFNRPGRFDFYINHTSINKTVAYEIIEDTVKDPVIIKFLKCYIILEPYANYDTLLSMIEVANNSKNLEEFFSYINIMNIHNISLLVIEFATVILRDGSKITKYVDMEIKKKDESEVYSVTIFDKTEQENITTEVMSLNLSERDIKDFIVDELINKSKENMDVRHSSFRPEMIITKNITIQFKCMTVEFNRMGIMDIYKNGMFNFININKLSTFEHEKLTSLSPSHHRIKAAAEKVATGSISGSMPLTAAAISRGVSK